jgi:hypothetical protein
MYFDRERGGGGGCRPGDGGVLAGGRSEVALRGWICGWWWLPRQGGSQVSFRKGAVEGTGGSRWAAQRGSHRRRWTKKDESST